MDAHQHKPAFPFFKQLLVYIWVYREPCRVVSLTCSVLIFFLADEVMADVFFFFSSAGLIGPFPPGWCAVEAYWIWTNYIAPKWKQQERGTGGAKWMGKESRATGRLCEAVEKTTANLLCCWSNSDFKLKCADRDFLRGKWKRTRVAWLTAQRRVV